MSDWLNIEIDRTEPRRATKVAQPVDMDAKVRDRCDHGMMLGLCEADSCPGAKPWMRRRYQWDVERGVFHQKGAKRMEAAE